MGIAPVQPANTASLAAHRAAQVAAMGDGAAGWNLAAFVPAGAGPDQMPLSGWPIVRVQIGPLVPQSFSRVGGIGGGGRGARLEIGSARHARVMLARLLVLGASPSSGVADEADGLGAKVGAMVIGDRLVVPASLLGLTGALNDGPLVGKGDLVMQVTSVLADAAFFVAEVSL